MSINGLMIFFVIYYVITVILFYYINKKTNELNFLKGCTKGIQEAIEYINYIEKNGDKNEI